MGIPQIRMGIRFGGVTHERTGIKILALENKTQFRLIFRAATSPQCGEQVRKYSVWLWDSRDEYDLEMESILKMIG